MMWVGTLAAQTLDGDAFTVDLTSIAEKAGLPDAYKGKIGIEFANFYNSTAKKYPTDLVKINALTNRVADQFSITFTLNGATMESAQFSTIKIGSNPGPTDEIIADDTSATKYTMERLADDDKFQNSLAHADDYVEIFKVVEEMPRFPGCEDIDGTISQKYDCARARLREYFNANVKYKGRAKAKGIEGTVVVQFNVQTDGSLTDITLVKLLGYGCDEESLRVAESMNHMSEKWSPGRQRGVPVIVQFTIPIKFPPQ